MSQSYSSTFSGLILRKNGYSFVMCLIHVSWNKFISNIFLRGLNLRLMSILNEFLNVIFSKMVRFCRITTGTWSVTLGNGECLLCNEDKNTSRNMFCFPQAIFSICYNCLIALPTDLKLIGQQNFDAIIPFLSHLLSKYRNK